jgi:alanine racemase
MAAGLRLTIDLGKLAGNWRRLAALSAPAECAAAVKADAYGIGVAPAVRALAAAGCRTFFVAVPDEGIAVRQALPDAAIPHTSVYVLNGFFGDAAGDYRRHRLWPVLGNPGEISAWRAWRKDESAALHVDTGMNRLGLGVGEAGTLDDADLAACGVDLVMSHLACADEPAHPLNAVQLQRFSAVSARFPSPRHSLANSAGIHHGPAWHFDLVRPGIALYGGGSHPDAKSDPVVTAEARILQVRQVAKGESVGYGATKTMQRDCRLAVLSAGYADGYLRAAGSSDAVPGAEIAIGEHVAPLAGRVSMDLIAADVTDVPDRVLASAGWAELFGPTIDIDHVAARAGTIAYELLTGLSRRAERIYIGGGA